MITISVTREYDYGDGSTSTDRYELEYDEDGYNPSVVRDMRDCVMSMLPDVADTEPADLTEYEETTSDQQDTTE